MKKDNLIKLEELERRKDGCPIIDNIPFGKLTKEAYLEWLRYQNQQEIDWLVS